MRTIKIGDKKLKNISQEDLLEITKIENVHLVFEHSGEKIWSQPEILDFTNTLFSDTVVIDYKQKRIRDEFEGRTIVFFLNYNNFGFHWHFKDSNKTEKSNKLRIESIKYLLEKGYDIPLY